MTIFRTQGSLQAKPESPALLFRDLRKGQSGSHVKFLWSHQQHLLDRYHAEHTDTSNIALELPTGSGKTLVGLLIAEFRRRIYHERVVYLCPTRQLCVQVHEHSKDYGITSSLLIGPQVKYDIRAFVEYQAAQAIAITTYSGLFNTNPRIDDPQVVICDDAHAADQHIASLWSMKISRNKFPQLFDGIVSLLTPAISADMRRRINSDPPWEHSSVDLVPLPRYSERLEDLADVLDAHVTSTILQYPWHLLRGHLDACNIFASPDSILIRPLISPANTHKPFSAATQRLFMSATLGKGGELERSTGIKNIEKLPIPKGWDTRGIGRRLILFPDLLREKSDTMSVTDHLVSNGPRTLVLVKDNRTLEWFRERYGDTVQVITATDIETSIDKFAKSTEISILVLANRYDGLDLPGDSCRIMLLVGLPAAADLQERFFLHRLGAVAQLRDRIRTRITQGLGRCTRDENDYALILAIGKDLLKWCCTSTNVQGMHPELQAEIAFGIDNSRDRTSTRLEEVISSFLEQQSEWDAANDDILHRRNTIEPPEEEVVTALARAVEYEIDFVYAAWQRDYERAYNCAVKATEALEGGQDLKPYRAFWHVAASTAAFSRSTTSDDNAWISRFKDHIHRARSATYSLRWLSSLADVIDDNDAVLDDLPVVVKEIQDLLEDWHLTGSRFEKSLGTVRQNIMADEASRFDRGLEMVGHMLGCTSKTWGANREGAPDGLWTLVDGTNIVFECKSNSTPIHPISVGSVRQALTHQEWLRSHGEINDNGNVFTVLVTPRRTIGSSARSICADLRVVHPDVIRSFFDKAADLLNYLRIEARGISEERLSKLIVDKYSQACLTHNEIFRQLTKNRVKKLPDQVR